MWKKLCILFLASLLIAESRQGCKYEEAQRLQKSYNECIDDSTKGSFSWMAAEKSDSAFACSYLTQVSILSFIIGKITLEIVTHTFSGIIFYQRLSFFQIFDKCNPLLTSCFTEKQVKEMTTIQIKAFNEIIKIGEIDLEECEETEKISELTSSALNHKYSTLLVFIALKHTLSVFCTM